MRTDSEQVDKTMVQTGPDKEERHLPYIPPHLLRDAFEPRHTAIHSPTADVPQRHQHNRNICRPAEQDKDQSPEKAAGVYRTMIKDSRFMHTHHAENQCQLRRFEKKFVFPCYFLTFFASNVYVGLAILYRVPIKKVE